MFRFTEQDNRTIDRFILDEMSKDELREFIFALGRDSKLYEAFKIHLYLMDFLKE
jgi:hypothetical protein